MTSEERKIAKQSLDVILNHIQTNSPNHLSRFADSATNLVNMLLDDKEEAHKELGKLKENAAKPNGTAWVNNDELSALQNISIAAREFLYTYNNGHKPDGKLLANTLKKLDACLQ